MHRALRLYLGTIVQFFRRIFYSFAVELVVGLCGIILLALFYYIFSDFLNNQVQEISAALATILSNTLAAILLLIAAVTCGNQLSANQYHQEHLAQVAKRLGENPRTLRFFSLLQTASVVLVFYLPTLLLVKAGFVTWQARTNAEVISVMLIITAFSWWIASRRQRAFYDSTRMHHHHLLLAKTYRNPLVTMVVWRIKQIAFRNRRAQFLLLIALGCALVNGCLLSWGYPHALIVVLGNFCGLTVGAALIVQIAQDCRSSWIEKDCGVSQREFFNTLQVLGFIFAGISMVMQALSIGFAVLLGARAVGIEGIFFVQIMAITATGPFLVPYLALQIDGKRAGLQTLTLVLVSLLFITAIFAHFVSIALLPLANVVLDDAEAWRLSKQQGW